MRSAFPCNQQVKNVFESLLPKAWTIWKSEMVGKGESKSQTKWQDGKGKIRKERWTKEGTENKERESKKGMEKLKEGSTGKMAKEGVSRLRHSLRNKISLFILNNDQTFLRRFIFPRFLFIGCDYNKLKGAGFSPTFKKPNVASLTCTHMSKISAAIISAPSALCERGKITHKCSSNT